MIFELVKRGHDTNEHVKTVVVKCVCVPLELEAVIIKGEKLIQQMSVIMADLRDWHLVVWKDFC